MFNRQFIDNCLKVFITVVAIIVVSYNFFYNSWKHIFWFSQIALIMTVVALWSRNKLLISMSGISILVFHTLWTFLFVFRLFSNMEIGLLGYMFNTSVSIYIRGLSLFHAITPILIIYFLNRYGYDRNALKYQTLLSTVVLIISTFIATEYRNINWVLGPSMVQKIVPQPLYTLFIILFIPVAVYYPTHKVLERRFAE